jgi:methionyl-tRNA synthetase
VSTVTCPEGHESTSTDYCDVCGADLASMLLRKRYNDVIVA